MKQAIKKIAVLGSGVMGSRIAAHFANAGIPSYMLDIGPKELKADEIARGMNVKSPDVRNRVAREGLEEAKNSKPPAFFEPELSHLITIGNFEDNKKWLSEVDWIIEVVVERLDVKQQILQMVDEVRKPNTLVTSNTSGIPISALASGRSEDFRSHFCGTHFFNPPRYMKLLEIIPTADTLPQVVEFLTSFGEKVLGKGVVHCKDTPNFIANRIGVFSMLYTIQTMVDDGYTIEEVDQITGPVTGRPKSATFRTADMVGIDTLVHVANNLHHVIPDDEMRETFQIPHFVQSMIKNRWLGDKTKQGFYKKITGTTGEKEILAIDHSTMRYRAKTKPQFESIDMARNMGCLRERIKMLASSKDRAGKFFWKTLSAILLYTAHRVPEICEEIIHIDNAMKWGFNWELGPFETWDALGVEESVERMKADGKTIPPVVEKLLRSGKKSFYVTGNGARSYFDYRTGTYRPEQEKRGFIVLSSLKDRKKEIRQNAGSSLIDLGDGVACLEFHAKMNAIGEDIIQMVHVSLTETAANFQGLVIGNQAPNFSVGANLLLILMEAQDENWDELDMIVRSFQNATMSLRYSEKPVVAAPFGMALGGGCEFSLGADRIQAAAELYMGLVEVGVGLIPAGGGTKETLLRNIEGVPADSNVDLFPLVKRAFETIGMAKVSTSALEARRFGYLRSTDSYSMNKDCLIEDAKQVVLGMATSGYAQPKMRTNIPVLGEPGFANLKIAIHLMTEAGYISKFDAHIGRKLGQVLCGGDLSTKSFVSEQYLLDLEREAFLSLLGEKKTQDRIKYMLEKGKPLRN
ncbi:MAG: 3-hydroxyacyl-CoA dehydrogenase/enoyl-CoA hydratase family protein [Ignavibacteria bacterium]|nr:3-hydroxyacyl-CoA dehydrogenase/enoyl-CoA hydratase family protein [Ignavibacteria bacterium]